MSEMWWQGTLVGAIISPWGLISFLVGAALMALGITMRPEGKRIEWGWRDGYLLAQSGEQRGQWKELPARLDIERASVLGAIDADDSRRPDLPSGPWRREDGRIVLEGKLNLLRGQGRTILRYLVERQGRDVDYEELGEVIWGDPEKSDGAIHTAIHRLKTDLKHFDQGDLAQRIIRDTHGYRLV